MIRWYSWSWLAAATLGLAGCPDPDVHASWTPAELRVVSSLSPPPALTASPGNRFADDRRAAELGRRLFFDSRFSGNGAIACATCHQPARFFSDGRARARGVADVNRNTPTLVGAQNLPFLFHDGRKDSVWSQALGPIENDAEHAFDRTAVVHRLAAHYRSDYEAIFGQMPSQTELSALPAHARPLSLQGQHPEHRAWQAMAPAQRTAVNGVFANFGKALEAYQRKLVPKVSPFDRFVSGSRTGSGHAGTGFSPLALRGLRAFIGSGGCVNCHNGPLLTDMAFHNLGLPPAAGVVGVDAGRSIGADLVKNDEFRCGSPWSDAKDCRELRFLNPKFEDFLGAFRTPSLRNVAQTAPYMHSGQLATLTDVIEFYRLLPNSAQLGHRELTLHKLRGSVDTAALVAFLEALSGDLPDAHWLTAKD
ncbi:MAG: hypothetical protein EXR77_07970 [Myxococcales bacterium]|nr:hypothetical protein [Myxococcales bacterium]